MNKRDLNTYIKVIWILRRKTDRLVCLQRGRGDFLSEVPSCFCFRQPRCQGIRQTRWTQYPYPWCIKTSMCHKNNLGSSLGKPLNWAISSFQIHVHHQGEKGLCKLNERRIHDVWRPPLLTLAISPLGRGQIENVKWGNCVPEAKKKKKKEEEGGKERAGSAPALCSNPEEHSAAWWGTFKHPPPKMLKQDPHCTHRLLLYNGYEYGVMNGWMNKYRFRKLCT